MVAKKEIDLSEFRRIRKPGCTFANLKFRPEHVDVLRAAMQSDDISGAGIHEWLKKNGYAIGIESVKKHRAGSCVCS
jgi:hypothetical protein